MEYASIDSIDYSLLNRIKDGKFKGTLNLAKEFGMAPKNLIRRINKYIEFDWVSKEVIALKPKGWKRQLKITSSGLEAIQKLEHTTDMFISILRHKTIKKNKKYFWRLELIEKDSK